ncbi:MAG: prepilin-type N-terminal cleavage/methylation domain-containing protein [Candidatus Omnitrophota bacterium]|nr:prepilin-type N-terminal cleavage/methylation domain-containing protein [Candidatus Omnitrophota bacterium]
MTKIRHLAHKKGFTLVEVLIAALIMGIGLISVGAAIYEQFSFVGQIRERVIADMAAQEEIEYIRGLPFNTIINSNTAFPNPSSFSSLLNNNNPSVAVAVDNYLSDPSNNIRRVSVTVSWDSFMGSRLQTNLVTLVTRNGIDRQ